jgi:hypothetical protein
MSIINSTILGKLVKVGKFTENSCIPDTFEKLLEALVDALGIELPANQFDKFITVSVGAPSDKTKIWLATDTSGNVISLRKYVNTSWQDLLPVGKNMVMEFIGNPVTFNVVGWRVLDGTNGTPDTSGSWIPVVGGDKIFKAGYYGN